jgi:phosphotransferase system enzyme I (PtsI)
MLILQGKGVSGGVAIGRARFVRPATVDVTHTTVDDIAAEWARYEAARQKTVEELERLYEWSQEKVGRSDAQIFSVHAMMVEDEDFNEAVWQEIHNKSNAEYAVLQAAETFSASFAAMDDPYMKERAGDVRDMAGRILRHLKPEEQTKDATPAIWGSILCAEDLTPSETVQLDRRQVLAFVTAKGSTNSHTAILSRTMNIPAVVSIGEGLTHIKEGALIAVDADRGCVVVEPDATTLAELRLRVEQNGHARALLQKYRERESRTLDGHRVEICANIGGLEDLEDAIQNTCDGIGLFRSEFLYLGRQHAPGEDEQFEVYRQLLQRMADRRVVVRTLDIGADKQTPYLGMSGEDNPALGLRAIRLSLLHPELFLTQAKALLRASQYGHLAVMFPFITSEREVEQLLDLWHQAQDDLRVRGIPYSNRVELGIMIETPAAALISDKLATMVDFFSIGSNDLTQYTLALDRQNAALEPFCDNHHEAVLRLIRETVTNAHRAGIWVGICGELGADLDLTEEFLRMGIHEFSVSPPMILPLRERVCTLRIGRLEGATP